ncbi:hypothetical protein CFM90_26440 (plasmid) [Ralstonia solanacearum]|nr:hypothetical protein CFM90_26440 [Ralstonia solanacearum]
MQCQPIASLAERKRAYWREVIAVLPMIATAAATGIALCAGAVKLLGAPCLNAALVCALIMAAPVWMLLPDMPTGEDVERDRALRREAGLPDDVDSQ